MQKATQFRALLGATAVLITAAARGENTPAAAPGPSSSPPADAVLQEVVVTAQKRSQRLSDVGITVATATATQLQDLGATDVSALNAIVPGFATATTFAGTPVYSLRGINFNAAQVSAPPAVSVYVDEAVLPYSVMTGGILLDIDHVEVLKGPQGTLFGQNATGGSINVIAAKPTSTFAEGAQVEVNNFGQVMFGGYMSGPVSDTLRARLAVMTTQFGAWQEGYHLNDRQNGESNTLAARLLVDWTPIDRLKVSVSLSAFNDRGEQPQPQVSLISPANPAGVQPGFIGYPLPTNGRDAEIDPGFDTHKKNSNYQDVLRLDYQLADTLTFTSLTDYDKSQTGVPENFDGTAIPDTNTLTGGSISSISQEFRLTGSVPSARLNYIVGANYQHDSIADTQVSDFINYSGLPPGAQMFFNYHLTNRATAAFANADFEIVPRVTLTGGVRYTDTKQTIDGCTKGNGPAAATLQFISNLSRAAAGLDPTDAFLPGGCITINNVGPSPDYLPVSTNLEQKQDNVSWRGGVNFKPTDDSLVYAVVSRGFKSGIFAVQPTLTQSQSGPVRQEELTAYEVGFKSDFFLHRLQVNLSGFYYDYKDKQFFTYVPTPPIGTTSTVVNIPKSKAKGIDLDVSAMPLPGLTLRGGLTYLDTQIGEFQGYSITLQPVNFSGKEFNFASPVSATFDAEYRMPVNDRLNVYVGGGGLYNSKTYADLGESPTSQIDSYAIFNVRLGLESAEHWRAGVFVRNLANRYYWNNIVPGGEGENKYAGMPRTFGINASYSY